LKEFQKKDLTKQAICAAALLTEVSKAAAQIASFVKLFSVILSKKYPVPFFSVRGILFVILS